MTMAAHNFAHLLDGLPPTYVLSSRVIQMLAIMMHGLATTDENVLELA